jgi:hypothetical protein
MSEVLLLSQLRARRNHRAFLPRTELDDLIRRCWLGSEAVTTAPLSQNLRRSVRASGARALACEAEARFEMSASAAVNLMRRASQTCSTAPAKIGGCRKPLLASYEALLREPAVRRKSVPQRGAD